MSVHGRLDRFLSYLCEKQAEANVIVMHHCDAYSGSASLQAVQWRQTTLSEQQILFLVAEIVETGFEPI
ncbi:hypothetical protein SLH49_14675 [Cognatiyoonia sp. IB215446]|uniref:hypothetical protein n=1 Tax=Cognatiyoonia sp. IB215446 TaxID=3097355 RepID=UPI002A156661|nr:hypothetical protein [Cognatiyoonia sp. IB215446]MDX8349228.1 hypothetical protein [Cognatiyoonia sp. IB215446]